MKFLGEAIKKEPIGALAVVISLFPFLYDIAQDHIFTSANLSVSCEVPDDTDFAVEDGFLYYKSRCLISNQSRDPVSVTSLVPVMLSDDYPYSLIGSQDFYPTLNEPYDSGLGNLYTEMKSQFPTNLGGRQTFATNVIFAMSVGAVQEIKRDEENRECSENLSFERLSSIKLCFDDRRASPSKNSRHNDDPRGKNYITAKTQIFRGYHYGFAYVDGFGIQINLGDGSRYIIEADLTDVLNYGCDESIRELACEGFGNKNPRLINIGTEPEYGKFSWQAALFFGVLWLALVSLFHLIRTFVEFVKNTVKVRRQKDKTTSQND